MRAFECHGRRHAGQSAPNCQHMPWSGLQATPANWPNNHESIDKKGWAFLLPTVSEEDAKKHFPDHHSCKVGSASKAPPPAPVICTSHLQACGGAA